MPDMVYLFESVNFPADFALFMAEILAACAILCLLTYRKMIWVSTGKIRALIAAIVVYMTIPTVFFLASFPAASTLTKCLMIILLVYSSISALRRVRDGLFSNEEGYSIRLIFPVILLSMFAFSYSSLFWGNHFVGDWGWHRTVLTTLYDNPLNHTLCYYYGSYLPSSYALRLIADATQTEFTSPAHILTIGYFIWNIIGVALMCAILPIAARRLFDTNGQKTWGMIYLIFLMFSGLDWWKRFIDTPTRLYFGHAEWSTPYYAQYSSTITLWQWAPAHFMGGLIGFVMLCLFRGKLEKMPWTLWSVFLVSTCSFSWVGIMPILAYFIFETAMRKLRAGKQKSGADPAKDNPMKPQSDTGPQSPAAGMKKPSNNSSHYALPLDLASAVYVTAIVLMFYFSSPEVDWLNVNHSLFAENGVFNYFLFLAVELLPIVLILAMCLYSRMRIPGVVLLSFAVMVVLPLFQLGPWNSIVMRGVIPTYYCTVLFCGYAIQEKLSEHKFMSLASILIFFLMITPGFLDELVMGLLV